jgi:hypothetical protein
MGGERSRTINGWFNGCFVFCQNAVGMADIGFKISGFV